VDRKRANLAKAKLKAGETVYGCFLRYPEPGLAEVMGYHGWDFLAFDAEHGTIEPRTCENLVRAAELRGVTPIVRVTTNQPHVILRLLDTGAQGLQVPWVNSAAEADAAVQAVKYHPRGKRGLANMRAADYGQTGTLGEYVRQANQETLIVVQIETAQAVEALPAIAAVPDIDVLFIGPADLSNSLGFPGETTRPEVKAAMDRIVSVAKEARVPLGIQVATATQAREWRDRGARYILCSLEAILRPASTEYLRAVRGS
jgi:4-hydroxy-2-oxoheptanedioate aldolase